MNQESPSRLEPNNQILAAPVDGDDPLPLELSSHLIGIERTREPGIRDLDPLEPPPLEDGHEPAPDAFDLGQLGHADTLAARGPDHCAGPITALSRSVDDLEQH